MDTAARVDIQAWDNATWVDAFQFGDSTDTSWSFSGQSFRLDIKGDPDQSTYDLSITSDAGQIVVDDSVTRILHTLVDEATITAALVPGEYWYDLIMYDTSTPAVRVRLMWGKFTLEHGITGG